MSFLDKTFCASPNCKNDCGRRMTDAQREQLTYTQNECVSYGYFCGEDDWVYPEEFHRPVEFDKA